MARSANKPKPEQFKELTDSFARKWGTDIDKAKEHLASHVLTAAQKVTSLLEQKGNPVRLRLQFDTAKHILKCNGLETENVEVKGNLGVIVLPALVKEGS